jgi:hypothetical protein
MRKRRKQHFTVSPKVRLYRNGKVTISGLSAEDAAHLLVLASIQNFEGEQEEEAALAKARRRLALTPNDWLAGLAVTNELADVAHVRRFRWVIDTLEADLKRQRFPGKEPTLKERLREKARTRAIVRKVREAAVAGRSWVGALVDAVEADEAAGRT